jgi:hypothetical protein
MAEDRTIPGYYNRYLNESTIFRIPPLVNSREESLTQPKERRPIPISNIFQCTCRLSLEILQPNLSYRCLHNKIIAFVKFTTQKAINHSTSQPLNDFGIVNSITRKGDYHAWIQSEKSQNCCRKTQAAGRLREEHVG